MIPESTERAELEAQRTMVTTPAPEIPEAPEEVFTVRDLYVCAILVGRREVDMTVIERAFYLADYAMSKR